MSRIERYDRRVGWATAISVVVGIVTGFLVWVGAIQFLIDYFGAESRPLRGSTTLTFQTFGTLSVGVLLGWFAGVGTKAVLRRRWKVRKDQKWTWEHEADCSSIGFLTAPVFVGVVVQYEDCTCDPRQRVPSWE